MYETTHLIRSENGYNFDTNVGINVYEYPNLGTCLANHIDFKNSDIHLCSQTLFEVKNLKRDIYSIVKGIESTIGAKVIMKNVTPDMYTNAKRLERKHSKLHNGDSQILAYAMATGTTLVTCDTDLISVAESSGTNVINPNSLLSDAIARNAKFEFRSFTKQKIAKPIATKRVDITRKANSFYLKPGKKITWSTFN